MLRAFIGIRYCGVRRSVILSSSAGYDIIRLGNALRGPARFCPAKSCEAWHGIIEALRGVVSSGTVRSCPAWRRSARQGVSLRGLALSGTVLSGPVRLCKARFAKAFRGMAWNAGAGSGPAGSSPVLFGKARHFMARYSCVAWGTVERGFVLLGKVFRGIVLNGEALHRVVKFCPVKHCYARHAKLLFWHGTVGSGFARLRAVGQAFALSRFGCVLNGHVRSGALLSRSGVVKQATVMRGALRCGNLGFMVMRKENE